MMSFLIILTIVGVSRDCIKKVNEFLSVSWYEDGLCQFIGHTEILRALCTFMIILGSVEFGAHFTVEPFVASGSTAVSSVVVSVKFQSV